MESEAGLTPQPALTVRSVGYCTDRGEPLLRAVDLTVAQGAFLGIVGPNGAGKSTLLHLLAGVTTPSSGEIQVFGQPLAQMGDAARARRLALVSQTHAPDGRLTVEDYVGLGRIPRARLDSREDHRDAVRRALDAMNLSALAGRRISGLSGGERQRAAIARALCQDPDVLFLDEPMNHLDPGAKGEILSLVAGLGVTVVCVMHDLTLLPGIATDVLLLANGEVRASGPTDRILTEAHIRDVFGVTFLRIDHAASGRQYPVLDVGLPQHPPHSMETC